VIGGRDRALRFALRRASGAKRLGARLRPPRLSRVLADFVAAD
jgi:hypothetical protein